MQQLIVKLVFDNRFASLILRKRVLLFAPFYAVADASRIHLRA
jgi:hypothetical protein